MGRKDEHILKLVDKIGLTQLSTQIKEPFVHKTLPLQGSADGTALAENLTIETDVEKGIYVMNKENKITLNGVGILEAKNTSVRPEDVPAPSRGPIQVQGLMMCSGFKWSVISIKYRGVSLEYLFMVRILNCKKKYRQL